MVSGGSTCLPLDRERRPRHTFLWAISSMVERGYAHVYWWARSSVVERCPDKTEVKGPIPFGPTKTMYG